MDSQIEEIKSKIDVVNLIGQHVKLTRAGRNYKGLCPFHSERSPSFMVSQERGTWRCFGCGEHGDIITFLEKHENLTFIEALEQLARMAGITLKKRNTTDTQQQKSRQRQYDLLNLSAEFYHYLLTKHEMGQSAREYINERGISGQTASQYTLGFAPNSWQSLTQYLHKKGFTDQELLATGMASQGRGRIYDRFRGRLMFPVTDLMNRVVGFSGRSLLEDSKSPKYLNSPEGELFHKGKLLYGISQAKESVRKNDRLILVEGNVDVLSSHQAGVKEVVAPLGTALTAEQISFAKRFTSNVYIAFDQDNAGVKAVKRGIELLKQAELNIRIVEIIDGADPDDCIQRNPQNWHKSIDQAREVFDYYLNWASTNFDLNTEAGKIQASQEIIPLISATHNSVAQSFLIKKTADALALDEQAIREEMKKKPATLSSPEPQPPSRAPARKQPRSRQEVMTDYFFTVLISLLSQETQRKEILAIIEDVDPRILASHSSLLQDLTQALKQDARTAFNDLAQKLKDQDRAAFDRYNLSPIDTGAASSQSELTEDGRIGQSIDDQLLEMGQALRELQRLYIKEQLNTLSRSLKQAELLDKKQVKALQQEFTDLSQKLINLQSEM